MADTNTVKTERQRNDNPMSEARITPFRIANGGKSRQEPAGAATPLLSIVVPVYNEVGNLDLLHAEILQVTEANGYDYELIFINDGSDDGSEEVLAALVEKNPRVRVVTFRRRYGQTAALSAGFKYARGRIIITMDGDLQNDPADIPRLMEKVAEGYDMVNGWRKNRQDAALTRTLPSRVANRIINYLIAGTCVRLNDYGCTLKAYKAGIVKNIKLYGEMHRFIPVFAAWLGVRMTEIEVNHRKRHSGKAKYNLSRVSRVILDLVVVRFFSDYGTRPIQFFGRCAKLLVKLGLVGMGLLWAAKAFFGLPLSYSSMAILLGLVLFSGLQMVFIGLLGEITMRTYYESQSKETYYIRDILEAEQPGGESRTSDKAGR